MKFAIDLPRHPTTGYGPRGTAADPVERFDGLDTSKRRDRYYIKELLKPSNPNGPYGTHAYGLSGFSNVLTEFAGGDGVIGIHGTNEPELVGTDVSHGCIRLKNDAVEQLVPLLPLGTPVDIQA